MHGFYIVIILSTRGLIKQTYEVLIKTNLHLHVLQRIWRLLHVLYMIWKFIVLFEKQKINL